MMLRLLYTTLFTLSLPLVLARLWWRGRKLPQYRQRIAERFGVLPSYSPDTHKKTLWFHTVSVGEFIAASQLIDGLLKTEQFNIVVTTTTPTGSEQVQKKFGDRVYHVYSPYDLPFLIKRFLRLVRPNLAVFMETELWPNTLRACNKLSVPTLLANGRLSEKSARGYAKFSRLTRPMLEDLSFAAIQNPADAQRFSLLGLNPNKQSVTGSIKFDIHLPPALIKKAKALKKEYSLAGQRPILIAASTHRGEDDIILDAYQTLLSTHSQLLLILVPRHPDRFNDVAQLCMQREFNAVRRSSQDSPTAETQILLGDTMGELMLMFGSADIAFIGGSFVPNGGHNYIEPAVWGLPILSGPSQFNFASIARELSGTGSLITCANANELATQTSELLHDQEHAHKIGRKGQEVVTRNQGATQKHIQIIHSLINP